MCFFLFHRFLKTDNGGEGGGGIKFILNSKPNVFCCTRKDEAAPSLRLKSALPKYFHSNILCVCRTKQAYL